ncbi:phosphatase PAP2 family protein [Catalinimonas niigatensis]|uniref:phosphatase PAP2 family protein n=1 Tax=Catalinimonas niigatensis TaxID=1397264 RepID=UPI00266608D8|nr:phosphatase PAP2 family protein [Catalinimonas niigatensis]WPP52782.1 phosphatase PAP2 family protein [Catalinimonas niigatensis]
MKNNILLYILCACLGSLLISSCEEDLPTGAEYSDYAFSMLDEDGGTWTPILLSAPEQIEISAPVDVTSDAYLDELAELKSTAANLSNEQRETMEYWTNNPIIRWNEIALELVAKYNLIPGPNGDGSYTLPNPAQPDGPSLFPFAHPPYASRMLAYLSVAQFDGLVAAWHYKYKYNRQAPYEVDASIAHAYTDNNLPSYPSDAAVVAVASREILSAMFPLEKEYLAEKAAEHLSSLSWAGAHVKSDIDAGQHIGAEVAKIALARAANDGMKYAQCPKPVSDSIKAAAFARFGWQWDNLEEPSRPVGLTPLFGKVKMWSVPTVEEVRPIPPPAPGSAEFQENVKELKYFADNMKNEWRRMANYWQDGLGTYTPPGHWNKIAKDCIVRRNLNPLRTARTFAYMNMAIMDAGISCWDAKYYYHYPRPIQTIPGYKTIAGTPNFPSYTSGHSAFSAAGAEVLSYLFPDEITQCTEWALEAAESRIYGGIHYRFDAEVGTDQGKKVAQYTIEVAKNDGAD